MKKQLLLVSICLLPFCVAAQVPVAGLISVAHLAARAGKNSSSHSTKKDENVTHFKVGSKSIPQKRTPAKQLHGPAAQEIQSLESFLTIAQEAYSRPDEKVICSNASIAQIYIQNIQKLQPKWDVTPYKHELSFYQQEQKRRQQPVTEE